MRTYLRTYVPQAELAPNQTIQPLHISKVHLLLNKLFNFLLTNLHIDPVYIFTFFRIRLDRLVQSLKRFSWIFKSVYSNCTSPSSFKFDSTQLLDFSRNTWNWTFFSKCFDLKAKIIPISSHSPLYDAVVVLMACFCLLLSPEHSFSRVSHLQVTWCSWNWSLVLISRS